MKIYYGLAFRWVVHRVVHQTAQIEVLYRLAVAWGAAAHSFLALLPAVHNNSDMQLALLTGCSQ